MMAVRHFTRWLAEEGEIEANPFTAMRAPKVDQPIVPVLIDYQLRPHQGLPARADRGAGRAQVATAPATRRFVRIMVETGMRASELVNIELGDLNLTEQTVVVRRGKGGHPGAGGSRPGRGRQGP